MPSTAFGVARPDIGPYPFEPVIAEFKEDLRRQNLAESYLAQHPGPARHLLVWVQANAIGIGAIDGHVVHRFLQHDCTCRPETQETSRPLAWRKRRSAPEVMRFVRFLERTGRIDGPDELCDNFALLDEYLSTLQEMGYAEATIGQHRNECGSLVVWLHLSRIALGAVDADVLQSYLQKESVCSIPGVFHGCTRIERKSWDDRLKGFLVFLEKRGLIAPLFPAAKVESADLEDFRAWLREHRGIGAGRIDRHVKLIGTVHPELGDTEHLDASLIRDLMLSRLESRSREYARQLASALRMYIGFLASQERCPAALANAVPSVPERRLATLPRYISAEDVERAIESCGRTPSGLRDRAILLLLARLALRAGDILALRLADIDWNNAELHVSGKTDDVAALPLPQDAGDALYAYIAEARPKVAAERVFLCAKAPYRPLGGPSTVGAIARSAFDRAGIVTSGGRGAHVFRHSAATALLRSGATLEVVGALLRHRSPRSTAIYAKVDMPMLQAVAQPWIGGPAT